MTNELIEAMARALQVSGGLRDPWSSLPRWLQSEYKDMARAALAAAETAGYRLVPAERLQSALEQVQGAMKEAYNSAYPECCGRPGMECCGSPEPAWRDEDQRIMDVLHPVQQKLTAMLAAAPNHSEQVRPMVSQWVPLTERLPEKEQYPVLVAHQSGAVRMVFGIEPFIEGDWMGYYEPSLQGRFLRGITHWMPLPVAPAHAEEVRQMVPEAAK